MGGEVNILLVLTLLILATGLGGALLAAIRAGLPR